VRQRQTGRGVGMSAVDGGCDVMVEGERIPGEAAVEQQRNAPRANCNLDQ
jgi:hypothetical protein